jgi:hypothetical protein
VIIHCGEWECNAELAPGDERCPKCGSENIMIGTVTPKGTRVSAPRDFPRMRLQGRHQEGTDRVQYLFTAGGVPGHGVPKSVRRAPSAPHIKVYNDVMWNADRQQVERREMYTDSDRDYYRQEWFSLVTGERTWRKEGRLSDPDMHGQSARRRPEQ